MRLRFGCCAEFFMTNLLTDHWPLTTALRRDLPDDALPVGAEVRRGAIKIAAGVEDYVAVRNAPIVSAGETVQHVPCPTAAGGCQLENCPPTLFALERRTVEIAVGVHAHGRNQARAVVIKVGEGVNQGKHPAPT